MPTFISPAGEVRDVWTSDEGSMAQETATTRWPKIVQGMVDDIREEAETSGPAWKDEAGKIMDALSELKSDILQNRGLRALQPDGRGDLAGWNGQMAHLGARTWLACPWLFAECYIYRTVQNILSSTKYWQSYDVFKRQKDSTFAKSRVAVEELAERFMHVVNDSHLVGGKIVDDESHKLLFHEMTQIALWGNATDLSLLSNLSLEQIQNLQGREAIARNERNIVDNDTDQVWKYLIHTRHPTRRIDIILDNSGFEFFTDLLYSSYLLRSGLASTVVLHAKEFPWFVSDVTPSDVDSLFMHLESSEIFSNRKHIDPLISLLREQFEMGKITVRTHSFWTTGFNFQEMISQAPGLLKCFVTKSMLLITKGDLNYRKLVRDGLWPHTTPFRQAIGPLGAGSGLRLLALRTNKADCCVGVESEEKVDALNEEAPNGTWVRNGQYAVISFSDGAVGAA